MNEVERIILRFAETCSGPSEFIHRMEKSFERSPIKKGRFFLQVGIVLYQRSHFVLALNSWNQALKYFIRDEDQRGESICYGNLGIAYDSLGDFGKAIEYYERSLKICRHIGDRSGESTCYTNLGIVYRNLGDFDKAIEYLESSLKIDQEIGDRSGESKCYGNLGIAYRNLGDFRRAIEYYERSLKICRDIGDIDSERIGNLGLCKICYESNPELSYDYCRRSIDLLELLGGRLVEETHKIGFYAQASDAYQYMVPLCLKRKRRREAFEFTERGKSRAFLEVLAATKIKPTVELTSELETLLADEEEYLIKLREIQTRYLSQT